VGNIGIVPLVHSVSELYCIGKNTLTGMCCTHLVLVIKSKYHALVCHRLWNAYCFTHRFIF